MVQQTRREFLEASMWAAAAAAAARAGISQPALAAEETAPRGPNDQLRVGIIGLNGRGQEHVGGFGSLKDCDIVAVCDVDEAVLQKKGVDNIEKRTGRKPTAYRDVRKLLEDPNVDVVSIATPNHWHALGAIWAIQAGKHVYVEKPVSHNVSEGRRIVDAARKYNKVCQTGTQSRSMNGTLELFAFLKSGGIGEISLARGLCYKPRGSIGPRGNYPIPAGIDYDLWSGPAPLNPLTRRSLHYDWHWQWDYGNGDLGNQGIHQMDLARWGLGVSDLGQSVVSYGGRFAYEDAGETANTQVAVYDYGDKTLVFEVRGLKTESYKGAMIGVILHGANGYAIMNSYAGGTAFDLNGKEIKSFTGGNGNDHFGNFVKAVRKGTSEGLNADILQGHLSSALCHTGNISYRLGETMTVSEIKDKLAGSKAKDVALETFDRFTKHLADNNVDLEQDKIQYGAELAIDAAAEAFTGPESGKANQMLTREYRKGFEVPSASNV